MSETEPQVCRPCSENSHAECDGTKDKPCGCLVCTAKRIGDEVMR